MVHAALRSLGPVVGGVNTVIQAMLDAIGPEGTLSAYVDWEPFYEDGDEDPPVFDKRIARAARAHGFLHEAFRTWPDVLRSDHPDAGVAAIGPLAERLTADHPFQYGYGEGSPFERFCQWGGRVLMLGAPMDTISLMHHAEHKAQIPGKRLRRYRRLMPGANGPEWVWFEEFDTCDPVHASMPPNQIEVITEAYLATGRGLQGKVGEAQCYLFEGSDLVEFGVRWIERFVNGAARPASAKMER